MEGAKPTLALDTQIFRDVFNSSPIGIAVENLDGLPLFVNPALCSMLGFSEEELRSRHCVDFSPPEDAEKDWALFQQLRAGSIDHYQLEKRYFRRDGSLVWGNLSISLLKRYPSPLVLAMVDDITTKKSAEEARFRHAAIVESSEDAIGSVTVDGVIESWNRGAQRIFGYTESEALGKSVNILVPPERAGEENNILETLKAGGHINQFETVRVTKLGERINVSLTISPIKDSSGKIVGFSGISRDITERKHAEDELRASEERFRNVFRDAGVGMVIVSPEGRFLAANQAFCDCLGYTEEELLQKTVQSVTLPEDWPSFSQRLREALDQGKGFQKVEKRCLHKSGRIVTTESSASLIRGSSGEPRYFVGEVLDITQRKLAEDALSGVSGRLIEAHEEERRWIARELHDDFNQRVALLALMLERVREELPATEGTARRQVEEASQHVSELGSDIQALSHRLHSSKLEYMGLVAAVAGLCRELSNRQNVKIDFHSENIPGALPKEVSLCLFRVVQEALHNSAKHSGVRHFEVRLWGTSDEIHLTVVDSGAGFDREAAMKSTGLGLTSMQERLRSVGGALSIESQPRRGTTVHARVPFTSSRDSTLAAGKE